MAILCFDAQRRCCIRLQDVGSVTTFINLGTNKGKRTVDVHQLATSKFDSIFKPEVSSGTIKKVIDKWLELSELGVMITPAARHAFAEITNEEKAVATKPKTEEAKSKQPTTKPKKEEPKTKKPEPKKPEPKKAAKPEPKKAEPKKPEPKKATPKQPEATPKAKTKVETPVAKTEKPKGKPTVSLKKLTTSAPRVNPDDKVRPEDLPLADAVVMQAPPGSNLKVGKTMLGEEPKSHTTPTNEETPVTATKKVPTQISKPTTKQPAAKPTTKKPEPKKAETKAPAKTTKKPEPKQATAKKTEPKGGNLRNKVSELAGKKIKVNAKADLGLVREGTILMAQMKTIMACSTTDEALTKYVKRLDGEKFKIGGGHIKKAVEYGFITLS